MVDQISGLGSAGSAGRARKAVHSYQESQEPRQADGIAKSAELTRLSQIDGIRLDKVLEVRRALANGTYVTPEKLDIALNRAIDDAFGKNGKPGKA